MCFKACSWAGEIQSPDEQPSQGSHVQSRTRAARSLYLWHCSVLGAVLGSVGAVRGGLGVCPQEYRKEKSPLEEMDHIIFRAGGSWILP